MKWLKEIEGDKLFLLGIFACIIVYNICDAIIEVFGKC